MLAENSHRFHGHPNREQMLAQFNIRKGDIQKAKQIYQDVIEQGSLAWENYFELGKLYVDKGEYEKAGRLLNSYPLFTEENNINRVVLSNWSYNAGSLLFWRGAYEYARPLYEFSANLDTGSYASLTSKARLAMMDCDFESAAFYSKKGATRYNSQYAYRDYMSLLHLIGESESAWALFDLLIGRFKTPQIWTSAWIGHRINHFSLKQLQQWIKEKKDLNQHGRARSYLVRYALLSMIDRQPDMERVKLVESLDDSSFYRTGQGTRYFDWKLGPESTEVLTAFHLEKMCRQKEPFLSFYGSFAKAYYHLQLQQFDIAYHLLKKRSAFFSYQDSLGRAFMPYLVWAGIQSGHQDEMDNFLALAKRKKRDDFDMKLAEAALAAGEGKHKMAVILLKAAFQKRPHTEERPLFSWYQLVELAEWFYNKSGRSCYLELVLEWSKKYQKIQPMFGWAYTIEAKYTTDPDKRIQSLAIAQFIDGQSAHLVGFSEKDREKAAEWMNAHKPFMKKEIEQSTSQSI